MESYERKRRPITLADFLQLITEEEDELQILNCYQTFRVGRPPLLDLDDLEDGNCVPPTMPPPMDDDDDRESDPDEKEYISDEVLNENDLITDPFFYQENIPEIEVQIYNPRLFEHSDWPVDPPSFPMPPEVHLDPPPIVDDNKPCRQAPADAPVIQDIPSLLTPVRSKVGQNSGSRVPDHQE